MARHLERARRSALESQRDLHIVVAFDLVGDGDEGAEQLREVDGRRFLALQFGIEPAGVGNIGNQTIEPPTS